MMNMAYKSIKSDNIQNKSSRWWDIPAAVLLLITLFIASARLNATSWTSHLDIIRTIIFVGIMAGLALGQSRFSSFWCVFFAILYGTFIIPWRLGVIFTEELPWIERLNLMYSRLNVIIDNLIQQKTVTDNLFFVFLMAALFWILSCHAAYTLTRHATPWQIIIPTGLTLVLIHSYDAFITRRVWYLVLFLFFSLILVARLVYLHNRNRWHNTNTYVPPNLGFDFIRVTMTIIVIILFFSWAMPARAKVVQVAADAWYRIKEPFTGIRDYFDNAFAPLKASIGLVYDYYGSSMALGRGNRLTETEVLTIVPPSNLPEGVRLNWRARIYDFYEDGGWSSTHKIIKTISPDDFQLKTPVYPERTQQTYTFYFSVAHPLSILYAAPQPDWFSPPVKVEFQYNQDSTADIAAFRSSPPLKTGDVYFARSSLSNNISIQELQDAGANYPEWVSERYLQLPDSITPRTIQLAKNLTQGLDTPYDKAETITNYLRKNIKYIDSLSELPNNQDLIDWFLFNTKSGFCNYYATAEIMLLRSLGVPSRLAVGYAQGEPKEGSGAYVVYQRDAHAWPEVFFPNLGWIEFEPTVSQPEIIRSLGEITTNYALSSQNNTGRHPFPDELDELERQNPMSGMTIPQPISAVVILLMFIVFITFIFSGIVVFWYRHSNRITSVIVLLENGFKRTGIKPPQRIQNWFTLMKISLLARSYMEINNGLTRLGARTHPHFTPSERAALLSRIIPYASQPVEELIQEYHYETYSTIPANQAIAQKASAKIRSISYRALFQKIFYGHIKSINEQE